MRTQKGVNEEIVKAIVAGKKKELDAMEAFGIIDVCEELPRDAKVVATRWENVLKGDKWRCRFVAREFRHDFYTSGSTAQVDWWTCMRSNTDTQSCASMRRARTSTLRKTRKCAVVEWRILGGS